MAGGGFKSAQPVEWRKPPAHRLEFLIYLIRILVCESFSLRVEKTVYFSCSRLKSHLFAHEST